MDQVRTFLEDIGLEHLFKLFENEDIRMEELVELRETDLEKMGVTKLGQRKRIFKAVEKMNKLEETSSDDAGYEDIDTYSDMQRNLSTDTSTNGDSTLNAVRGCNNSESSALSSNKSSCINDSSSAGSTELVEFEISTIRRNILKSSDYTTATMQVSALLQKITEFKENAFSMLSPIYKDITEMLHGEVLGKELTSEIYLKFADVDKILEEKMNDLEDFSCPIVVTGETSAGKSSFVNLLLGVELLPHSSLSCTSTICRIHNKKEKSIISTDQNDHEETQPLSSDAPLDEMRKVLKQIARMKHVLTEDSETQNIGHDEDKYKFIDIYWPIPYLDDSIVIVDTPGIGPDYPELTKRLYQYLPKALAFIFVLNTPNDGGVQSDRILQIQHELQRRRSDDNFQYFDPQRAIFICNKWDLIDHDEEEEVFTKVESTLKQSWTKFLPRQLFKLSTKEEMSKLRKGQPISEEFNNILKGIEDMIPASTLEKYHRHLFLQNLIVETCLRNVLAQIKITQKSKEDKEMMVEQIEKNIEEVNEIISTKKDAVLSKILVHCDKIAVSVYEYICSKTDKLFTWADNQLPNDGDLDVITKKIDELVLDRLNDEINIRMRLVEIPELEKFIENTFNEDCFLVLQKCDSIDHVMFGDCRDLLENTEIAKPLKFKVQEWCTTTKGKTFLALTSPVLVPTAIAFGVVVGLVLLPVGTSIAIADKIKHRRNVLGYKRNKGAYAMERGSARMAQITVESLQNRIMPLLRQSIDVVLKKYFEEIIPLRLHSGYRYKQQLQAELGTPREIRQECHRKEQHILRIYDKIIAAQVELFCENMIPEDCIGSSGFDTTLELDDYPSPARVTTFKYDVKKKSDAWCNGLADICRLRKLHHQNLITIYGIHPINKKERVGYDLFTDIWEYSLDTLVFEEGIRWTKGKEYIRDAIKGLTYLHEHCLVHKDIRLSTILVERIDAKHAQLACPHIGEDKTHTGKIDGIPIIKSPETLKSCASFEADIFQIGIVIWEVCCGKRAFHDGDKPIKETYEDLDLAIWQGLRPRTDQLKSNIQFLVQDCWHGDPDKRPSLAEIKQALSR